MLKMKAINDIKKALLVAIGITLFYACTKKGDDFDYNKDVILITGTETSPLVKFSVEDTPSSYVVTATATDKVSKNVHITFGVDDYLVDEYNEKYNTSYYSAPASSYKLEGAEDVIESGKAASSGVRVSIVSTEDFVTGRAYVIPVSIKSIQGEDIEVLSPSKTIFLKIARTFKFNSLDLSDPALYAVYLAPEDKAVDLPNYTFEIKCYLNGFGSPISRLCNLGPSTNLFRFGEHGHPVNSLQWLCPGGGLISSTLFAAEKWYHISVTFDGSKYVMYVDGVKDAELAGTEGASFNQLELGMSWTSYGNSQRYNGRIAEVRVWDRALTTGELQIGLCGVDPKSDGLVAYWKMNEGEGHIFHDATEHGYDMDWSNVWREEQAGQGNVPQDKSSSVKWIMDDKNKCSQ